VDIRYEIAEKRAAEGTATLDENEEHAYLTARNTLERESAVKAAIVRHAEQAQTWTDDVTVGFEVVTDAEDSHADD
jgi:hypothetical protein